MNAIEARKPKLPPGMKSLMSLWSNSASVINATGVDKIIDTIQAFDGYWSENDLKKFLNIVQTLRKRNNITKEKSNKLNTLNGRIRGLLPNNGSPSRSGHKRTRSNFNNGGNTGTTPSTMNRIVQNSKRVKINPKTNLRIFLNSGKLNRLTNNNKNQFVAMLNPNGSNLKSIKKQAYNLHRNRVFNASVNIRGLKQNQLIAFKTRLKNGEKLKNIITEARNSVTRSSFGRVIQPK
jgi:hypothetical protein